MLAKSGPPPAGVIKCGLDAALVRIRFAMEAIAAPDLIIFTSWR